MGDDRRPQQLPSVSVGSLGRGGARRRGIKTAYQQKSAQHDDPNARLAAYVGSDGRYRGVLAGALAPLGFQEVVHVFDLDQARELLRSGTAVKLVLVHDPLAASPPPARIVGTLRADRPLPIVVLGGAAAWRGHAWPEVELVAEPLTAAGILEAVARLRRKGQTDNLVQRLRQTAGFGAFSAEALTFLLSRARAVQLTERQALFQAGDAGRTMYFVISGEVGLYVGQTQVERVGAGGLFGELAMLEGTPRSATAVSLAATVVLEVPSDVVDAAGLEFRVVLFELISRTLARRLRQSNVALQGREDRTKTR